MTLCRHDIDTSISVCLDCLPVSGPVLREQVPSMFGPWTEAEFCGRCAGCRSEIRPGDDIRADGQDGWLGRCCGEEHQRPPRACSGVPDPKDILQGRLRTGGIDRGSGT